MMDNLRIFSVYEVDSDNYIIGPSWGDFTNLSAAQDYMSNSIFTPDKMVIIESDVYDSWPIKLHQHKHNELTYFTRNESTGKMEQE